METWFQAPDYWLARLLIQRGLALVYLIGFLVAFEQFPALLGDRGLLPVRNFAAVAPFRRFPSLFQWRYSDRLLRIVAGLGIATSLALLLGLLDAAPVLMVMLAWALCWASYLSIVNVGQTFYSFGWETLLLEAGFLAIFLGPAWLVPATPLIYLFRWLLFRVEFGAGLIKMRGDRCWRDLTCLYYHHETQPMPNPLSWYFHWLPKRLHRLEVLGNHFAQLVAPIFLFAPQPVASLAGLVMALTQCWLLLSGNFSWLNLITVVLAFAAFDDAALSRVLPIAHLDAARVFIPADQLLGHLGFQDWLTFAVTLLVLVLSIRPARNLFAKRQLMNASFDPLHLVNTYGAFGSITKERYEVVLEGTADPPLTPQSEWREYEFRAKPGDLVRRPPQWAPYHLRLDWLMWFAAFSSPAAEEWFVPLVIRLLQGDRATLQLLGRDPFPDKPPYAIRARYYLYHFTTPAEHRASGAWWKRTLEDEYLPPMVLRQP